MYKLLIVEDEDIIRNGISKRPIWKDMGFIEIITASNGAEALEYISKYNPHVVFTDIKMPVMDGLELLCNIKKKYPDIKTVVLSGFNDFEYAQKALEYGACGYILKPTSNMDIKRVFGQVIQDLEENEKKLADMNRIQSSTKQQAVDRYNFLKDLVPGKYSKTNDIVKRIRDFGLNVETGSICCAVLSIKDNSSNIKITTNDILNFFEKISISVQKKYSLEVLVQDINMIVFIISSEGKIYNNDIKDLIKAIKSNLDIELNIKKASIGIGKIYDEIENIGKTYEEAVKALKEAFFKGLDSINVYTDTDYKRGAFEQARLSLDKIEKELLDNVLNGENHKVKALTMNLFETVLFYKLYDEDFLHERCMSIISKIRYKAEEQQLDLINVYKNSEEIGLKHIKDCTTIEELRSLMGEFLQSITCNIGNIRQSSNNKVLKAVEEYVNKNYMNKITLEDIAKVAYMNTSYFSDYFKKKSGQKFSDYVARIRVEHAKKLLSNPMFKIYEVSEKVGFADESYFCKVFKKFEGVYPFDYKADIKKDSDNDER